MKFFLLPILLLCVLLLAIVMFAVAWEFYLSPAHRLARSLDPVTSCDEAERLLEEFARAHQGSKLIRNGERTIHRQRIRPKYTYLSVDYSDILDDRFVGVLCDASGKVVQVDSILD